MSLNPQTIVEHATQLQIKLKLILEGPRSKDSVNLQTFVNTWAVCATKAEKDLNFQDVFVAFCHTEYRHDANRKTMEVTINEIREVVIDLLGIVTDFLKDTSQHTETGCASIIPVIATYQIEIAKLYSYEALQPYHKMASTVLSLNAYVIPDKDLDSIFYSAVVDTIILFDKAMQSLINFHMIEGNSDPGNIMVTRPIDWLQQKVPYLATYVEDMEKKFRGVHFEFKPQIQPYQKACHRICSKISSAVGDPIILIWKFPYMFREDFSTQKWISTLYFHGFKRSPSDHY